MTAKPTPELTNASTRAFVGFLLPVLTGLTFIFFFPISFQLFLNFINTRGMIFTENIRWLLDIEVLFWTTLIAVIFLTLRIVMGIRYHKSERNQTLISIVDSVAGLFDIIFPRSLTIPKRLKKLGIYMSAGGACLVLLGVLAFAYGSWQYDALINGNPWRFLAMLSALLAGYIGIPILAIGLLILSLSQKRILRFTIWLGLLTCLSVFIPFPVKCPYEPFRDVVTCTSASVYQPEYWILMHDWMFNDDTSIRIGNRGLRLADEAYGDVFREILKTIPKLKI